MGHVIPLGDPIHHFWLTRSVARSIGLNLSEVMVEGRLTPQSYAEMVTKCRQCPLVLECQQWLATHGGGADAAPEQCLNAAQLNSLL